MKSEEKVQWRSCELTQSGQIGGDTGQEQNQTQIPVHVSNSDPAGRWDADVPCRRNAVEDTAAELSAQETRKGNWGQDNLPSGSMLPSARSNVQIECQIPELAQDTDWGCQKSAVDQNQASAGELAEELNTNLSHSLGNPDL